MKKALLMVLLAGLTACKKEAPKCTDEEVKKLVTEIMYNNTYKMVEEHYLPSHWRVRVSKEEVVAELKKLPQIIYADFPNLDPSKSEYFLDQIRTVKFDEKTGAYACKGMINIRSKQTGKVTGTGGAIELSYIVELTDDGDNFVVTVLE